MDKNVFSAIIRDKKPESLDGVEPFEKEWGGRGDGNECVLCMCVSVSETTKRVVVVRRRDAGREGKKNNSFPVADSSPNALYKYVPFDSTLSISPDDMNSVVGAKDGRAAPGTKAATVLRSIRRLRITLIMVYYFLFFFFESVVVMRCANLDIVGSPSSCWTSKLTVTNEWKP
jgi:hypothetical protein